MIRTNHVNFGQVVVTPEIKRHCQIRELIYTTIAAMEKHTVHDVRSGVLIFARRMEESGNETFAYYWPSTGRVTLTEADMNEGWKPYSRLDR